LFICGFAVFLIRVAQQHVGLRTTDSGFITFLEYTIRYDTLQTTIWYAFSAWLFSELVIFTAPASDNLKWIVESRTTERPRLNERPIYLTTYFFALALVQTACHLIYDYDRLDLPTIKTAQAVPEEQNEQTAQTPELPIDKVKKGLLRIGVTVLSRSIGLTLIMPLVYSMTVRKTFWSITLWFAKIFWNLPRTSVLPSVMPYHIRVLFRTFWAGLMLSALWEVSNLLYTAFVAQPPLKKDRPITYESKDPNGSLLTGLNAKKLQTRAFAFWELVLIAEKYEGRRKAIFEDIDRPGGSSWKQIMTACLGTTKAMDNRILSLNPLASPTEPVPEDDGRTPQIVEAIRGTNVEQDNPQPLPRLTRDIRKENIWANPPPATSVVEKVGNVAKLVGNSPQAADATTMGQQLLQDATQNISTAEQGIWAVLAPYTKQFLQSPFGAPFRKTMHRRLNSIVLGQPYGNAGIIIDAIEVLRRLTLCSLKEDSYGHVSKDIPEIIQALTTSIGLLEGLRGRLQPHWTDVVQQNASPEVGLIIQQLKAALKDIVTAFDPYFRDMGVSRTMVSAAQDAVSGPDQAVQKSETSAARPRPVDRSVPEMTEARERRRVR
jgi:nucleoporin NDC1